MSFFIANIRRDFENTFFVHVLLCNKFLLRDRLFGLNNFLDSELVKDVIKRPIDSDHRLKKIYDDLHRIQSSIDILMLHWITFSGARRKKYKKWYGTL